MINLHKLKIKMQKTTKITTRERITSLFVAGILLAGFIVSPIVTADRFEEQIRQINQQNAAINANRNQLLAEAESFQAAINALQLEISALQAQIQQNEAERDELNRKIAEAEAELVRQKSLLSENIRAMYLEGEISTVEMLFSSKDLSEFVDKEQYRTTVKNKIKSTLDRINALKAQLATQKEKVERLLAEQQAMRDRLASQQAEQSRMLAMNASQRAELEGQMRANSGRIAELRRQQAIENARFTAGVGVDCGGGYPGSAPGPWGNWGCNYPRDNTVDSWGMFNRQCVSYTAFKVAESGRNMPKWGFIHSANAKDWDDLAEDYNIPVDGSPRQGDVAISNSGYYGHAMYVEHVYGDGTILISQYNVSWDGRYSTARITAGGLSFIHFR